MKLKLIQNKMKIKFTICFLSFLFIIGNAWGQVTIGNGNVPAKGALLDMKETESSTGGATSTKGVVFPRVSLDSLTSLTPLLSATDAADAALKTTHKGAVVYNVKVDAAHNLEEGFYYWDAAKWIKMTRSTSVVGNNEWLVSGNGGTNSANNFVGTTDAQPLVFKVNNTRAGYLSNTDGFSNYTSLGLKALSAGNTGEANVAVGYQALTSNTSGAGNSAVGMNALAGNVSGSNNTAVGNRALANSTGQGNTAVGSTAMTNDNMTGSGNVAVGQDAMHFIVGGNDNTGIGTRALINTTTGSGNTAMGNNAMQSNVSGSNNTALGLQSLGLMGGAGAPAGENNVAVGLNAGKQSTTGSNNIFLGANTQVPDSTGSYQMNIGNFIFGTGMNGTMSAPAGRIGIGTTTPQKRFHVAGNLQFDGEMNMGGSANTVGNPGTTGQLLTSQGAGKAPLWLPATTVPGSVSYMQYIQGTTALNINQGNQAVVPGASFTVTVPAGVTQTVMVTVVGYAAAQTQQDLAQGAFELWVDGAKVSSAYCSTASNNPPNSSATNGLYSLPIPATLVKFVTLNTAGNHVFAVRYSAWKGNITVNLDPSTYGGYNNDKECMLTKMTLLVYNN